MHLNPSIRLLKSSLFLFLAFFSFPLFVIAQVNQQHALPVKPPTAQHPAQTETVPTAKQDPLPAPGTFVIKWQAPQNLSLPDGSQHKALNFKSVKYTGKEMLPCFFKHVSVTKGQMLASVTLINPVYQPLETAQLSLISRAALTTAIVPKVVSGYAKHLPVADISFIPLRINPSSGQIEKLVSFEWKLIENPEPVHTGRRANKQSFVSASILSTGTWYRIGVTSDGVYKMNYRYLKSLGIDMKTLDPRNLKLYGNGGGMLPFQNSAFRYDDLVQNSIYISNESKGKMDTTDYVLFYGRGQTKWRYNPGPAPCSTKFNHIINTYSDTTYYFINTDLTTPASQRMPVYGETGTTPTNQVNTFDDYAFAENDAVNLIQSGREFYGDLFSAVNSYTYPFNFPNIDLSSKVRIKTDLVARNNDQTTTFDLTCQNTTTSFVVPSVDFATYWATYAAGGDSCIAFTPTSGSLNVTVSKELSGSSPAGTGWMNYVEVNARRALIYTGPQMSFRDTASVGPGKTASFNIAQANSNLRVLDISNFANTAWQSTQRNNTTLSFTVHTDSLRQFIVFDTTAILPTPLALGPVANQNLHGLGQTDMIIITHPAFLAQAERLAEMHLLQDTLTSVVVTPQQIYNEFSSGSQDIVGLRDFVKMFYDRSVSAGQPPRYLLLLGTGSYDPKNRVPNNTNFILAFENDNSIDYSNSYVSDEFYGLLDDSEGAWDSGNDAGFIDIGMGRIPVTTPDQAKAIVDKIVKYTSIGSPPPANSCNTGNCSPMGDWRNTVCFVADDDASDFISQAEQEATMVDTSRWSLNYNIDKIYSDAYQEIQTPGGGLYPTVNIAIDQRVERGALIINYTGHGGEEGWSHKRILQNSDINAWNNICNMPLFMTATCEFSTYDDPSIVSSGELVLLNSNGGGIALLSTTRETYSSPNFFLNQNFYNAVFTPVTGGMPRLGDVYGQTEIASGNDINNRNFTLLGDPAIRLAYPYYGCKTTSLNTVSLSSPTVTDTAHALDQVTVKGYVTDRSGNMLSNFNGTLYPTVFDKPTNLTTLSNDGPSLDPPWPFQLQNSVIYKGKATIKNGMYQFSFPVPKDIAYNYGAGRISYYFENGVNDGAGYSSQLIIGGSSTHLHPDTKGPTVRLYLNDSTFVYDGTTNENPQLYAILFDSSGVNTVGNGVGHDLSAVLDGNTSSPAILNDYYTADMNTYKSGRIRYPYTGLSEGVHTLRLKVWDVYDNSSQAYTEFIVSSSAVMALKHVLNYPNPFTSHTQFFFEDNECCQNLNVSIEIFTVSGKMVKSIQTNVYSDGFRSPPIDWDGRDDFGDKIGRGVYVYRISVRADGKPTVEKYEKLVILN